MPRLSLSTAGDGMYMLDTNVLIDFLRGTSRNIYKMLLRSDASLIKVPAVVKAELLLGAEKSSNPEAERHKAEALLLPFEIVPFDDGCTFQYAKIRAYLEHEGLVIGSNDLLIAATALAYSSVLVTNNTREFERVPGLVIEDWAEMELPEADD